MTITSTQFQKRMRRKINASSISCLERKSNPHKSSVLDRLNELIPQKPPFRFVDELLKVDESGICGTYRFKEDEYFYKGHFPDNPVTPGVILIEAMAQIGLIAFGAYLYERSGNVIQSKEDLKVVLTSSEIRFRKVVYPSERIWVKSEKIYFKHNALKCKIMIKNHLGEIVCQGVMSGMFLLR